MPSTETHGTLAEHVYGGGDVQIPSGFEVLSDWPLNDGYSGTAYINRVTKEIIISHRGTDGGNDMWANLEHGFVSDFSDTIQHGVGNPISDQLKESEAFVRTIMNSPAYKDYNVSQTGHSLGGFLATINGAKFKTQVEAFDPPGSADYLGYLLEKKVLTDEQVAHLDSNLITHISRGSLIDLISRDENYLGTLKHVKVDAGITDVLKKHSIKNINKALGNNVTYITPGASGPKSANVFTRIHELLAEINASVEQLSANLQI